jgi:hypothetical protein
MPALSGAGESGSSSSSFGMMSAEGGEEALSKHQQQFWSIKHITGKAKEAGKAAWNYASSNMPLKQVSIHQNHDHNRVAIGAVTMPHIPIVATTMTMLQRHVALTIPYCNAMPHHAMCHAMTCHALPYL